MAFSASLSFSNLLSLSSTTNRSRFRRFNLPHAASQISSIQKTAPVIIVGGGLAGLSAATHLNSKNIPFFLLEASDAIGGRVRTDIVDGFLLDRGFQIFITAYPEAQKLLNYDQLNLQKFYSGARVFYDGQFHTVADPLRHFTDSIGSLTNPIGSILDKLLIGLTRIGVLSKSDEEILSDNEFEMGIFQQKLISSEAKSDPGNKKESSESELIKSFSRIPTIHTRYMSDQLNSNISFTDSFSPESVFSSPKLRPILSGKEVSEEIPMMPSEIEEIEHREKKKMISRKKKKKKREKKNKKKGHKKRNKIENFTCLIN